MTARQYQDAAKLALERHYDDVRVEWPIAKAAQDAFAADTARYAPRVDIAVGPFNLGPALPPDMKRERLFAPMRKLFENCKENPNPRCLLAIEVTYSGTSKHVMGDMLNASAMGLFGVVVGNEAQTVKVSRILEYLTVLAALKKTPPLFQNLVALSAAELDAILAFER